MYIYLEVAKQLADVERKLKGRRITLTHCSAKSLEVLCWRSADPRRLHNALMAPSTATTLRVHSAETSR